MSIVFGILGTLLVITVLMIISSLSANLNSMFGSKITDPYSVSINLLLVVVTAVYVAFTYGILRQSVDKEDRDYIEKRLQKLYYPLLRVLDMPSNSVGGDAVFLNCYDRKDEFRILLELVTYSYLARDVNQEYIECELLQICKKGSFDSSNPDIAKLKEIVKNDVGYYKQELKQFVGN